jgi:hypothetical protein
MKQPEPPAISIQTIKPLRSWGSPLAAALAADNSRRKPPVTLPQLKFMAADGEDQVAGRNLKPGGASK